MRANLPGPKDLSEMTVIDGEAPSRIVEQAVSAGGKRRTQGTYTLHELPGGGTDVRFELRYLEMPRSTGLLSPLLRVWLAKAQRAGDGAPRRAAREPPGGGPAP